MISARSLFASFISTELRQLKFAIDQAALVSITNLRGEIVYVNDKYLEVSKYSKKEILGKNHRIFNSGYHSKEFFKNLWDTVTAGRVWKGEICDRTKGGSFFWVDTTIIPFFKHGRPYRFMSIRSDITDRKIAEAQVEEQRIKQFHEGRLAAVGEIAVNIAHEIKNPLQAICLEAQLLRRMGNGEGFTRQAVLRAAENIDLVGKRMEKIIDSLQLFSRDGQRDPVERVDLNSIVEETVRFCAPQLQEKKIDLQVERTQEPSWVRCRQVQVCQVLLNLINNARDAVENLDVRWIKIQIHTQNGFHFISVTDSGSGISIEIRNKIMLPFFSTKDLGKGTGLGLSISQRLMEENSGELLLDEQNVNTRFLMKLPIL